jgi:hypothetical protein
MISTRVTLTFFLLSVASGCGSGSGGRGAASIAAATSSGTTAPATTGAVSTGATTAPPFSGTVAAIPTAAIVQAHAPLYRFNAWVTGSSSPQNRNEDAFPMSVARFFDELASGKVRVVTQASSDAKPSTNAVVPVTKKCVVGKDAIDFPAGMCGDEPGNAPVYVHAYEDPSKRVRRRDGSGETTLFLEYWLFYPQDTSHERLLLKTMDLGGHRGDWEAVVLRVVALHAPGGAFAGTELRRAVYLAHGKKVTVEPSELELVDDSERRDPKGGHPVVYVSLGKHASYPEPGTWTNPLGLPPGITHDECFRGNGVAWASWRSPRIDLEGRRGPEFVVTSFEKLLVPYLKAQGLVDWRAYAGRWGPDTEVTVPVFGKLPFGDSPRGPRVKGAYGTGERGAEPWAHVKATASGLKLGRSAPVAPAPIPVRRP